MKISIFGLAVSSSWGNGHATLWRGLIRALALAGHHVVFFERDVPYYASHRDLDELPGGDLVLYAEWADIAAAARRHADESDAAIVTSFCPDGQAASRLVQDSRAGVRVFYDLDTPVTLDRLLAGEPVPYLPEEGLGGFDLVLSYTGGSALAALAERLGARRVRPLYGSVDPDVHRPAPPREEFRAALSHLGTYSDDRAAALDALLLRPARRRADDWFVVGGPLYPPEFPWTRNMKYIPHVAPADHAAFYCSSPLTLNVTRAPMAERGWCPSARLFEAAACGVPVVSDAWPGLDQFFRPGSEILIAHETDDVLAALALGPGELARIGTAARERACDEHTAQRRAFELTLLLADARSMGAPR